MLADPRSYRDEGDLARMCALLQAGRAARTSAYYVHRGDIQWWLYYPPIGMSLWEHIYLWDDPDHPERLLGWVLVAPNGETIDVYCQPELCGSPTAEEMFAWAEDAMIAAARRAGRGKVGMFWVTPEDTHRVRWLEERGYKMTSGDAALCRALDEPIAETVLPEGFAVRSCRGLAEVEARARAQYGAFSSKAPFDPYVQRFTRLMQSAAYRPDADVVAASADGQIAAFAITWTDDANKVGLFEPVGTHPDFQRKGLGRAVMLEALRRLKALGMQQAIVCTPLANTPAIRLYGSVGFRQYTTFQLYEKELG